jgi:hypothetical protein
MKTHHNSQRFLLFLIFSLCVINTFAQDQGTENLQSAIDQKSITFLAQWMSPMKGGSRQLNPGYELTVKGDTLIANLPYVGRAYQASMDNDGGFNFTSYQFDYQIKLRKKGGWNITIKTKDLKSQRQFNLTIFQNGSASLNVSCNDRESISYNGSIDNK